MSERSLKERVLREKQWRRCAKDEKYALRTTWSIKVPGQGRLPFNLRPAQEQAIDHWKENRYSLTLKARQIGWSTSVGAHAWHETFFFPDREVLFISKGEREAQLLLSKVRYGLDHLPSWMWARGPTMTTASKTAIEFSNGSSITSLPSASDPARSFSGYLIVVDEWGFLNDPDAAWASIEPVADVGGRIIGLSTANGHGNFFHTLWTEAETGVNFFKTMFQSWRAGGRDDDWYATKKANLPSWQLAQEYPDNPEEAFLKSGNPVFDLDTLWAMNEGVMTPRIGTLVETAV
jgi:hypothetical protein